MADSASVKPESLKDEVSNLLEEARMVLPGIQALFGFQFMAVFNEGFRRLEASWQGMHLGAMLLVALAVLLVMTPAAYHRIAEPDQVSRRFTVLASRLIAGAMVPFALGVALELAIIAYVVTENVAAAAAIALVAALAYAGAWFVFPLRARTRKRMPQS